ncbi:alpha-glucuronidase family glycosyl hydrolase [uncultured Martelella sp.]|uniref:alpha-glucuronidase family glycosyl hydrolase n=1 Tax=uncultured Martelella sp. TaxID=392331 RepID=UPI0029C6F6EA|nr:alpha-glucuronidase family glycosyl hydrolase [uncultured Martelella sp.]
MNTLLSRLLKLEADRNNQHCAAAAVDEDGYDLWLRYLPLAQTRLKDVEDCVRAFVFGAESPTLTVARDELERALFAMLVKCVPVREDGGISDGAVLVGTPDSLPVIADLDLSLSDLGKEGYRVRSLIHEGKRVTAIAANTDIGVLYGCFAFLRHIQTGGDPVRIDISSAPKVELRLLNHWDNLDGSVERGYAGFSIWDWWTLPDYVNRRYIDYARANASIGINGTVLNNVNAAPEILTDAYLAKAARLADVFRPYGLKVFLSVNFASPLALGETATSDPADPAVQAWWKDKASEVYRWIPDFGGFLVKANSEGQPGPGDYDRSHADGANMLADALAPHGGILIWRAFVYASDAGTDRATEALNEFKPLDGTFRNNVLLQVKNGPIDFQPREPFSPIFGQITKTPLVMEFQITKEYLGQATHLAYLGPVFEEVLKFDTYARGPGSTVSEIVKGKTFPHPVTGIAAVANIGTDRDWTGGTFNQANWYVFGRMAWDPDATASGVAEDWVKMTFTCEPGFVSTIVDMMMRSPETLVNYMMPFGLHHQVATGHHYGPGPWVSELDRPEWNPTYYNRADKDGIGFNRLADGSNAIAQYSPAVQALFADPHALDERYLLWFHHVSWDFPLSSGKTLWQGLAERYDAGVAETARMIGTWDQQRAHVDGQRFAQIRTFLEIQHREAQWWRDACLAYFSAVAQRPLPEGHKPPAHPLAHYREIHHCHAPGNPA